MLETRSSFMILVIIVLSKDIKMIGKNYVETSEIIKQKSCEERHVFP